MAHASATAPLSDRPPAGRPALILHAKAPRPGRCKTRLARRVGEVAAAGVAAALLADLGANIATWAGVRLIACEDWEFGAITRSLGGRWAHLRCVPGTLGDLLTASFAHAFAAGYAPALAIGGDLPDLRTADLEAGLHGLAARDAVLGPAEDGGYYLIGLRRPTPEAFSAIPWSTAGTLSATLERLRQAGRTVHLLGARRDVDTWADLAALLADPARRAACPRTARAAAAAGPTP